MLGVIFLGVVLRTGGGPSVWLNPTADGAGNSRAQRASEIAKAQLTQDEGDGWVHSLEDLRKRYGEPPEANFGRMRIPSIGVDAPLGVRYVGQDGAMLDPSGPADIVYYDFSGWTGLGGFPTAGGNAVFAGHVDKVGHVDYAGVDYLGPAVFFSLGDVDKGDDVIIDLGTGPVSYEVKWVKEFGVEASWADIMSNEVPEDSLTLITCGGDFDKDAEAYTHRTVVRAIRPR